MGSGRLLNLDELQELQSLIHELFQNDPVVDWGSGAPVIVNLPGKDPRLDVLLDKIVSHEKVKSILFEVLGSHYKLWEASVRRSDPGDKGLLVHQDSPGQTNLTVLLSDGLSGAGATAFFAKSHRLPRWAHRISWSRVRIAKPWLTPLRGEEGEFAFFLNRTWHARLANDSSQTNDALQLAFFPVGGSFVPFEVSDEQLTQWEGSELRRLLDSSGTKRLENGRVEVVSPHENDSDISYAMSLEKSGTEKRLANWGSLVDIYIKVLLLELVFLPARMMYRLFRSLARLNGRG